MANRTYPYLVLLMLAASSLLHAQGDRDSTDVPSLDALIRQVREHTSGVERLTCEKRVMHRGGLRSRFGISTPPVSYVSYQRDAFFYTARTRGINRFVDDNWPAVMTELYAPAGDGFWSKTVMLHPRVTYMMMHYRSPEKKENAGNGGDMLTPYTWGGMSMARSVNLMAIHLRPDLFRARSGDTGIHRKTIDGTAYNVIQQEANLSFSARSVSITRKYFVNRKTGRIERVRVQGGRERSVTAVVQDWREVAGTTVPKTVSFRDTSDRYDISITYHDIRTDAESVRLRRPDWADDPALSSPEEGLDQKTLKNRVRTGKAGAGMYLRYTSAYLKRDLRAFIKGENEERRKKLIQRLEEGIRAHPASGLLREQLALVQIMTGDRPGMNKRVDGWREQDRLTPLLRYVRARGLAAEGSTAEAKTWSASLRNHSVFGSFARGVGLKAKLSEITKVRPLIRALNRSLSEKNPALNMRVLSMIEPPLKEEDDEGGVLVEREVGFLNALVNKTKRASVRVVAARALARNDQFERALDLFNRAPDKLNIEPERNVLVSRMEEEGKADRIPIEDTTNLKVLHRHAINALRNGETDRFETAMKRIEIELKKASDTDVRDLFDGEDAEEGELIAELVHQLMNAERTERARAYLKMYREESTSLQFLIRGDRSREVLKDVFESDANELYRFARVNEHQYYREKVMNSQRVGRILRQRIRNGAADVRDYLLVTYRIAASRELSPDRDADDRGSSRLNRYIEWLDKGIEAYPERVELIEGQADAMFMVGNYRKAAKGYRRAMDTEARQEEKDAGTIRVDLSFSRNEEVEDIERDDHPFLKMAFAYKKMGAPADGRAEIMKRLKRSEHREIRKMAARGLHLLGDTEGAISIMRERFRELQKKKDRNLYGGLVKMAQALRLMHYLQEGGRYLEVLVVGEKVRKDRKRASDRGFDHYTDKLEEFIRNSKKELDMEALRTEFLRRSFPEPEPEIKNTVNSLIQKLSARQYDRRQRAFRKLKELGLRAAPLLKNHVNASNPEVRGQIQRLINDLARTLKRKEISKLYSTSSK